MEFDIRTAILGLAVGNLVFGLILLLFQWGGRDAQRIPYLVTGKLLQGVGWLLLFGRGSLFPDWLSFTAGNIILIVGTTYDTWAMYRLSDRPVSRTLQATSAAVVVVVCLVATPLSAAARVALTSFTVMVFFALGGWVMLRAASGNLLLRRYIGWSMWLMAAVTAVRGAWAALAPELFTLFSANTIQLVMFAVLYYLMLTNGFGLLLLAKDRADRELRASEARFRSYFEMPIAGYAISSPEKGWLAVNERFCAMLGYARPELDGLTWADLTHPDDVAADEAQFRRVLAGETDTYVLEKRYVHKRGASIWVDLSVGCVRKPDGAVDYLVALANDITARKQAEAALHAAYAALRQSQQIAHVGSWRLDLTSDLFTASEEALAIFGFPADCQPTFAEVAACMVPGDRERSAQVMQQALQSGEPYTIELRIARIDSGEFRTIVSSGTVQHGRDGRPVAIAGTIQDITERKAMEEELRESERRYRLLAENSNDVIWTMTLDGRFSYVSPSVLQLRGYTPEEVMLQSPEEAICPGSMAALQAGVAQVFRTIHTGERLPPAYFQIEQPCKDGSTVWTEATARTMYDEFQRPVGIVGVSRDITERWKAEEALRISEARHRLLAENARDVVWVMGLDGSMVYTSPSVEQMRGLTPAETHQQSLDQILTPDSQAIVQAYFQKLWGAVEAGLPMESFRGELQYYHKDGSTIWTEVMAFPVPSPIGGFVEILGVTRDISERKRAEDELRQINAQLAAQTAYANQMATQAEAANRAKSQFLANMSHELRTPLNAILGFSELMTRDPNISPAQAENLAIINRSGEHLLGLINDVLDMAKIEAGRTTLQEHHFDLHRLLTDLGDMFRLRAAAKGLALQVTWAADVPRRVHADEGKLRQVLINLLGNAVKFTATGGIDLTVQPVRPATGCVCTLRFAVQDTGPGIPNEALAAIFEPFVQTASGRTAPEGTGLGLPISRQFARLMGGELAATSAGEPGLGSRFVLEIPVRTVEKEGDDDEILAHRRALHLAPDEPVRRLLVVEDSAASRKLLADLLTQLGFAVRTATDGQEAFQVFEEWQPHLIWMDMRMPVMDGREAARRIKATPQGRATAIVALSAGVLSEDRAAVLADGCDEFLGKPFRAEQIVDCLVRQLGVRMVYADAPPVTSVAPAGEQQQPFDLAGLPAEWREQVRQAANAADAAQLFLLAAEIEEVQPACAAALRAWAEEFDYAAILAALPCLEKDGPDGN